MTHHDHERERTRWRERGMEGDEERYEFERPRRGYGYPEAKHMPEREYRGYGYREGAGQSDPRRRGFGYTEGGATEGQAERGYGYMEEYSLEPEEAQEFRFAFAPGELERRQSWGRRFGQSPPTNPDEGLYEQRTTLLIVGPFTGRGPRGWQRSDERILEDVCDRLTQHGYLDASDMEVEVGQGEVTLNGYVRSRREKRLAEDILENVPGVRDIHNRLRVRQTGSAEWMRSVSPSGGMDVRRGMDVFGSDGDHIGQIKEVRESDILIDRRLKRDVYAPLSTIQSATGTRAILTVPADRVDEQGWASPEITGMKETIVE